MKSATFARSLARMAAGAATLWLFVVVLRLVQAALGINLGVPLPALYGAAFLAATYLMIRLLARRIADGE